ncbi:MAG: hypothetical protein ACRDL8_13715, partial [Solirubrobacteraceae bacterium]
MLSALRPPAGVVVPPDPMESTGATAESASGARVETGSAPIAGLASASSTRRPWPDPWLTIMAVTGSRCSSDGSTTSSRERCSERASDSLSPAAREVDTPHAVLVLIPVVSEADSDVPREVPDCAERDPPPPSGSTPAPDGLVLPVPVDRDSLSEVDVADEAESPT